ncbi:MAG: HdeD family acid-resistance protein [Bacilli bacterium]
MEYIEKIFKKTGWISILESIIFAILGIIVIWKPEGTVKAISYILGIIFVVVGIGKIINYFSSKGKYDFYNYNLIYGLMACILGIVTIVYSNTIGSIFRIIVGVWIIYSSFMRMSLSVKLKTLKLNIWVHSLILSIIMFICGLYITMNSGAVIVTIGIMMIVYSIIDIIEDVIFMKNVKEVF